MTRISESFVYSDRISSLLDLTMSQLLGSLNRAAALIDSSLQIHYYNEQFAVKVLSNRRNLPPYLVRLIRGVTSENTEASNDLSGSTPVKDSFGQLRSFRVNLAQISSGERENNMGFDIIKILKELDGNIGAQELLLLLEKDYMSSNDSQSAWKVFEKIVVSEKIEAVARLSSGMAHQINNPLTYVVSNFDVLQNRVSELNKLLRQLDDVCRETANPSILGLLEEIENSFQPEDSADLLGEAQDGLARIADIVKTLGRLGDRTFTEEAAIDVNNILRQLTALIEPLNNSKIMLELELCETIQPISGDRNSINIALLNLLGNAAEAMEARKKEHNRITVHTDNSSSSVLIEIKDSGVGMTREQRQRIFEPFYSTKPGKIGLGLPVALHIIKMHGGSLDIDSSVGEGTRVIVKLPAGRLATATGGKTESQPNLALTHLDRVLVIDDEKLILKSFSRLFRTDLNIVTCDSANGALDILARDRDFGAILIDMVMPVKSGIRLSEEIGEKYPELHDKIIFITGGTFTEESRVFLEKTDRPCIFKPIDKNEVIDLIKSIKQPGDQTGEQNNESN